MSHINDQVQFSIRDPLLDRLSFCEANEAAVAAWIAQLPITNLGSSSRLIFNALTELNQLMLSPATRLALLDLLRFPVRQLNELLARHFSNQPLQISGKALETARLAQALQTLLWRGYKLVLIGARESGLIALDGSSSPSAVVISAIERAIIELGEILLRGSQLYAPTPPGFWRELHQLYLLAEQLGCTTVPVTDPLLRRAASISIEAAYLRVLLFDTAQPQQMRQQNCLPLYQALEQWSAEASLVALREMPAEFHFRVDLNRDRPAIYVDPGKPPATGEWRLLNLKSILEQLEQATAIPPIQPLELDIDLVTHLLSAWGVRAVRRFQRIESADQVEIIIGLPSIHFHRSDRLDFSEWLDTLLSPQEQIRLKANKPLPQNSQTTDIWASAFDAESRFDPLTQLPMAAMVEFSPPAAAASSQATDSQSQYPIHQVKVTNSSVNGYRLRWQQSIPERIQHGTLIGIRANSELPWSIAITRWTQLDESCQAHIGIELLGPNATPCAVRAEGNNSKAGEFMRGLLLPEVRATRQPASLILFRKPFRTRDKITLVYPGHRSSARLMRQLRQNHNFVQFEFLELQSSPKAAMIPATTEPNFDQLWQIL